MEERIIAVIMVNGTALMANTSEGFFEWFYIALAIFWVGRLLYLTAKK